MPATEATVWTTDVAGNRHQEAKDANYAVMAQLTMACTTEAAMPSIYDCMTDVDWPSGLAFMVVSNAIRHKHLPNN
jgi:hypothetical protein